MTSAIKKLEGLRSTLISQLFALVTTSAGELVRLSLLEFILSKAGTYRDTVSVEPGSTTVFVSVSVSKRQFLGIEGSKDTFS